MRHFLFGTRAGNIDLTRDTNLIKLIDVSTLVVERTPLLLKSSRPPRAREDVLATDNALQWDLPGRAVEIPAEEFTKESFQENLATFLEKATWRPWDGSGHAAPRRMSL